MEKLVIFGTGMISDVAFHHFVRDGLYQVVAFTCDAAWIDADKDGAPTHHGLPLVPFEEVERTYPPDEVTMFVALGYHELNALRVRKCSESKAKGFRLASYISPKSDHGPWLDVGENCLILDSVGIQPGVRIGNNVSIWNNVLIGHHSVIEDDCWLAAGATIGGAAVIGRGSFIGLNATIGGHIKLGFECFLGASTLVLKSAPAQSVFIAKATEKFRLESPEFLRMTMMPAIGAKR